MEDPIFNTFTQYVKPNQLLSFLCALEDGLTAAAHKGFSLRGNDTRPAVEYAALKAKQSIIGNIKAIIFNDNTQYRGGYIDHPIYEMLQRFTELGLARLLEALQDENTGDELRIAFLQEVESTLEQIFEEVFVAEES